MRSNCWHGSRSYTRNRSIKYRFTRRERGHQKPPKHGVQIGDESTETGDRRFLSFARFRPIMTRTPASAGRGNAPSGRQSPSPRCTCRHRSPLARWSIRCTPPDGGACAPAVADAAGTLPATLVAGALWLLVAGGFLYAFAAELDAMRTRPRGRRRLRGYLIRGRLPVGAPGHGDPLLFLLVPGYTLHRGLRVR